MTSTQKKMQKKGDVTAKSPGFAGAAKSPGFAGLGSRQRKSKEFLIIGAQGMLGRHLVDEFSHRKIPFCAVGRELDVCDLEAVKGLLSAPWNGVINATAYTNVEQAETEEGTKTAFDVNAAAVWNMAKIACENGYPFIHYSTDYVFGQGGAEAEREGVDGSCVRGAEAEGEDAGGSCARGDTAAVATFQPRKTTDLTHPVNAYARSKDCGEKLALAMHPKGAYIVRCAWLYGLYGRNFVKTMVKLAKDGKSPQVVDDQIGQPTYAKDVARQTILLLRGGFRLGFGMPQMQGSARGLTLQERFFCSVVRRGLLKGQRQQA